VFIIDSFQLARSLATDFSITRDPPFHVMLMIFVILLLCDNFRIAERRITAIFCLV
jgi:hypothetical protein